MTQWLFIDSLTVEAYPEVDDGSSAFMLPRGAYLRIVKQFTTDKTDTGAKQTLFWIRFQGQDNKVYLCAPQWFQYKVFDEKPAAVGHEYKPLEEVIISPKYKLVRIDDEPSKGTLADSSPLPEDYVGRESRYERRSPRIPASLGNDGRNSLEPGQSRRRRG